VVLVLEPIPTATPTPEPTPTATPEPAPVATPVPPVAEPVVAAAPVRPLVPLAFDPFPVVRIKGELTATGARVTLLSVRAPRDARIDVSCTGRDCPVRAYKAPAGKQRLSKFERELRAGTRLEIRVSKPGYIGKYTSILIRRQAEPKRLDRCLEPGVTRPVKCVTG
jgi:hypothetical protein